MHDKIRLQIQLWPKTITLIKKINLTIHVLYAINIHINFFFQLDIILPYDL